MGSGKTSAAINYIKEHKEKRFIYITPYLNEVERIIEACNDEQLADDEWGVSPFKNNTNFFQPKQVEGRKLEGLKKLLENNCNIVTTHALLINLDEEIMELIAIQNYTLILDEVMEVVKKYTSLSSDDKKTLFTKYVHINEENNLLEWNESENLYKGRFDREKNLCELKSLCSYNYNGMYNIIMWLFPIEVFHCFKDIFILTYMFDAQIQKYYFDMNKVKYSYCIATKSKNDKYVFKDVVELPHTKFNKSLINIYNGKLNDIGEKKTALSANWYKYQKEERTGLIERIKYNTYNYVHNIVKSKSGDIIWTCKKDYKKDLQGKGYARSWYPFNIRATNELKNRSTVCYLSNRYVEPIITNYFKKYGVIVDNDKYALSELLQFLWRSCIREDKPINLYIPSSRMRTLLENWLNTN